jgi:hypothetical protein
MRTCARPGSRCPGRPGRRPRRGRCPIPASAQPPAAPASTTDALAALDGALAYLAAASSARGTLTIAEQADILRAAARAQARLTATCGLALAEFVSNGGLEADGQCSPRSWLMWQARVTRGAATGSVGWMRRLDAHPQVADALADGEISESWARCICYWTDRLPEEFRADADRILIAAAIGGVDLPDLAALAEEMYRRCAPPDADGDDGFARRSLRLDTHFRGAGKLDGNLTPECNAALSAVLESLGKKAGPEDDRTKAQRDHDALEEACRRLIAAGGLPDRAGQPVQIQLHATLDQLPPPLPGQAPPPGPAGPASGRDGNGIGDGDGSGGRAPAPAPEPGQPANPPGHPGLAGAGPADATDDALLVFGAAPHRDGLADVSRGTGDGQPGWLPDAKAAEAYTCDARIAPMICGRVDGAALAAMTAAFIDAMPSHGCQIPGCTAHRGNAPDCAGHGRQYRPIGPAAFDRLQDTLLRYAVQVLSGPGGLAAAWRRQRLGHLSPAVSLPLDVGAATEQIPPHLRRAVIKRDRRCAFPGCHQPPAACQVHHIIPRSKGGPTRLDNLMLLCAFHHLIAVHRWGWTIMLHGDGTVTARSPDGTKTLHSHAPPART